ncbi:MAG: TrkH family potassium uptake protein [Actinomycetia bacterium]|nr:TrkH family potassium uptake protein [Actinomycetes bacterium]
MTFAQPRGRLYWAPRAAMTGHLIGIAISGCAVGLAFSTMVGAVTDQRALFPLGISALLSGLAGVILVRHYPLPRRLSISGPLTAVGFSWIVMILLSTTVYLTTGATDSPLHAGVESTAGFATMARTVFATPEDLPRGLLFWRATTQLIGGFGALFTVVVILPFLGIGGAAAPSTEKTRADELVAGHTVRLVGRMAAVYGGFATVGTSLFWIGGMGLFDAVTYSFTTVSTGGFANHADSFAHFDSAHLEWFAAGGMLLAGTSVVFLWRGGWAAGAASLRSFELWAYLAILSAATVVLTIADPLDEGTTLNSLRHGLFASTSTLSTTGHHATDWNTWGQGPATLLMMLITVGAMAGSPGGGLRVVRALALVGYFRRELVRQVHRRAVIMVKIGREAIPERVLDRMITHLLLLLFVGAAGAVLLALDGADVLTATTQAVSALATVGPGLGDAGPTTTLLERGPVGMIAIAGLGLLGRLEFYPIGVALWTVATNLRRRLRDSFREELV